MGTVSLRGVRRAVLLVGALLLAPLEALHAEEEEQEASSLPPRVREIQVLRENVFSEAEARDLGLYRLGNALHIVSRESYIRRTLVFEAGDLWRLESREYGIQRWR